MVIHGLNKTTLLDYPGHVAATVFFGGCNFRCPFCHNGSLVLSPAGQPVIPEEDFFSFLNKRKSILEGVCITGGEPTLIPDLPNFIKKIKSYGLLVKLDTNGYKPEVLISLANEGIIDYVAMDIKSSPTNYHMSCGLQNININKIKESADFLINGNIPYEFRTTVVKELHTETDFAEISNWLSGAGNYFLQNYKESEDIISPGLSAHKPETLLKFKKILEENISNVSIRGLDI